MFIVIEGTDASGKSTLVSEVQKQLAEKLPTDVKNSNNPIFTPPVVNNQQTNPFSSIDALKAFFMLYTANYVLVTILQISEAAVQNYILLLACTLLLGNAHSVFLKFKGIKFYSVL